MEVKSKFNIGNTIYYMYGEHPKKDVIIGISFFTGEHKSANGLTRKTNEGEIFVDYYVKDSAKAVNEIDAFSTKEELQKSVFANL